MPLAVAPPEHLQGFIDNMKQVNVLLDIHRFLTGSRPGRRHMPDILNKSALTLEVACWEAFIEDMCSSAFQFTITNCNAPSMIPNKVLACAAKPIVETEDREITIWTFSGTGWKDVLQRHKELVLDRYIGKLNTPKPAQIDKLCEELLGYRHMSNQWNWQGMDSQAACERLINLIVRRGSIAHRVNAETYVRKKEAMDARVFLTRLAVITSNRIRMHLFRLIGTYPWPNSKFRSVE